ncbi:MAG: hypothetical protein GX648_00105 [Crenarchaeota archaeon]|nr:hypothetical protein [Thermoproteota archaeon]
MNDGDIIVTMTDLSKEGDTLGYSAKVPASDCHKYLHNQRIGLLCLKTNAILPDFLYWVLRTKSYNQFVVGSATGSTVKHTSPDRIKQFTFGVPSLKEQTFIANLLSSLDSKIQLNHQMNCSLEAVGAALFRRWFVDFEFPNQEGKPYRSTGGKMTDSELGNIPNGWSVIGNISELCEEINYGYTQSSCTEEVGPKFLRVMDINKADWIDWSAVPFCEIDEKIKSKYLLSEKDIVIARMADPGKIAIYEAKIPAVFASYLIRIRLKKPILAYYIYYLMKSSYYQNFIEGAATGSVQKSLNAKALTNNLPIILPNEEIASMFDSIVGLLRKKINLNLEQSTTLSKIRDSLLPKLMSGKIRVPINKENLEMAVT